MNVCKNITDIFKELLSCTDETTSTVKRKQEAKVSPKMYMHL